MNQQLQWEFAGLLYKKAVDTCFKSSALFDSSKRLQNASWANLKKHHQSILSIFLDGLHSQKRSSIILTPDGTTRLKYPALVLAVMLSTSVFFGELSKKFSLYQAGSVQQVLATANPLPQTERPASREKSICHWSQYKPLRSTPLDAESHTSVARKCNATPDISGRDHLLLGVLMSRTQGFWHVTSRISRAPPIAS